MTDDRPDADEEGEAADDADRRFDDADRRFDDGSDDFESREDAVDDPFAELGAGVDDDSLDPSPGDGGPSDAGLVDSGPSDRDPFSELDDETEAHRDLEDAFEQMNVGSVADEDVWEVLDEDATDASFGPTAGPGAAAVSGTASDADETVEHVVDKRSYCQQCPHFTAPPEVACDHEGTAIVEVVGFGEFRVRNCPMISEDDPTFEDRR